MFSDNRQSGSAWTRRGRLSSNVHRNTQTTQRPETSSDQSPPAEYPPEESYDEASPTEDAFPADLFSGKPFRFRRDEAKTHEVALQPQRAIQPIKQQHRARSASFFRPGPSEHQPRPSEPQPRPSEPQPGSSEPQPEPSESDRNSIIAHASGSSTTASGLEISRIPSMGSMISELSFDWDYIQDILERRGRPAKKSTPGPLRGLPKRGA